MNATPELNEAASGGSSPVPCPASLKVGAKVWIYDGQAPPRDGTISASGERIVAGAWYARDTYGERLYSKHSLFTDSEKLIAEVQDTVNLLERWEREFRPNVKVQAIPTTNGTRS